MTLEEKVSKLKDEIAEAERELRRIEGQEANYLEQLKDMGLSSIDEAEEKLEEYENQHKEIRGRIEAQMARLEEDPIIKEAIGG